MSISIDIELIQNTNFDAIEMFLDHLSCSWEDSHHMGFRTRHNCIKNVSVKFIKDLPFDTKHIPDFKNTIAFIGPGTSIEDIYNLYNNKAVLTVYVEESTNYERDVELRKYIAGQLYRSLFNMPCMYTHYTDVTNYILDEFLSHALEIEIKHDVLFENIEIPEEKREELRIQASATK